MNRNFERYNMVIDRINIEKDHIQFGDIKVYPPFVRETVDAVLGTPKIEEKDIEIDKNRFYHSVRYTWGELGIVSSADCLKDSYSNFIVYLGPIDTATRKIDIFFPGQVLIGKKEYTKASFKVDESGMCHMARIGSFKIDTILADRLDELRRRSLVEWMTKEVEITYKEPRPKSSIYDLKRSSEPVLHFDSYQFKLMVIEELMYKKGLLSPKFDIYDYAEKNPKREIDVDSEGYEAIPEAKKWFKDYPIPDKFAPEITELTWDGGLEVFHQIYPFWDGEDDFFDIKKLSLDEIKQFVNLKKVNVGTGFSKKAIKALKDQRIEVED